ncbi:Vanillin dehydrogenase [Lachnellula suecica]|uniref:Vanillin dehydrogenase n=1 Tax=Lachnellula suecica TaxID=602035 RepID=A0A8T9CEM5_9HELO|nr:Vanillin dehydrogenase [Lachnellula suecica]
MGGLQSGNGDESVVVPLWINGKEEFTSSTFDVTSPNTNETCWKSASATKEDALRAVKSAQAAFPSWSNTKPTVRRDILFKAADLLEAQAQENGGYMMTEIGADTGSAMHFIVPLAISMLRDIAARITSICGSMPVCQDTGTSAIVFKEPYGVTLGIVTWNGPYVFGIRSAATAIATGNTAILKASELTPRCYWAVGKAFHDAGLPAGVLNIISCKPEEAAGIANVMIEHPAVRHINFTGSTNTGRKVASVCAQNLKPCLMELGGKNSAIVLPDANLVKAIQQCIAGSFLNAGQICMSTDRIILHSEIAPAFLSGLKAALSSMPSDKPLPKVVSAASKARLDAVVAGAVSNGASILFGTLPGADASAQASSATFAPTIISEMKSDMPFWNEEAFGPVVGCMVVQSEDEAIAVANKSAYGLSASVFTQDLRRGLRIAKRLESGAVHINSMTVRDEPTLPFGGVKSSGWGRFNAAEGMEAFLTTKTVTWDG